MIGTLEGDPNTESHPWVWLWRFCVCVCVCVWGRVSMAVEVSAFRTCMLLACDVRALGPNPNPELENVKASCMGVAVPSDSLQILRRYDIMAR